MKASSIIIRLVRSREGWHIQERYFDDRESPIGSWRDPIACSRAYALAHLALRLETSKMSDIRVTVAPKGGKVK